jgi:glycosyltransferase involved in cell wall biosynthesis
MKMPELSVIIPNRNSPYTTQTIEDVLKNAGCEVEVIVNVDENWPDTLVEDSRVIYTHPPKPVGLRQAINTGVKLARGKYILKCDDHVAFGENFGRILIDSHQDNWVQIPRRYALDVENWKIEERTDNKYPIDQMYLDFPLVGKKHDWGTHGVPWQQRRDETKEHDLVETMSMQGSCYFMTKDWFNNHLNGLHEEMYGQFAQESQEIGFKTWLGGGKVVKNRKTWYAHLHKGKRYGRMYRMPGGTVEASNASAYYWMENKWKDRKHDMKWLIDRFWPIPSWPDNWEDVWKEQSINWPNKV